MFHKVINCSSLHHTKLQHLSLMLFSFMVCHKRSPKPTTLYPTFTWDVPRAFFFFFCSWKANATARTGMSSTTGKAWIFRDFGTSYHRGLSWGLAAGEPGHGAAVVAPAGGGVVPATSELPSWACIAAAWWRWDVPSPWVPHSCCCFVNDPSKFELSRCCCLVQGWLMGGELDPLFFSCELISLFHCLNNWGQLTLVLNLCK